MLVRQISRPERRSMYSRPMSCSAASALCARQYSERFSALAGPPCVRLAVMELEEAGFSAALPICGDLRAASAIALVDLPSHVGRNVSVP